MNSHDRRGSSSDFYRSFGKGARVSRPSSIEDEALVARLSEVFQDVGYEGASLARLSDAAGLQRASLYHRFPGGKRQMAEEVLASAVGWMARNVVAHLVGEGDLRARWARARQSLDEVYAGGRRSCLLNMLMAPRDADGPFAAAIRAALAALIQAFCDFAREAGHSPDAAARIGRRAVALIQGGLVVARGLGDPQPFQDALASLEGELIP
jgi:AcrR family transcriptional regulator